MTTPIQYPLINGLRHSFNSIEINIGGLILYGTAINYKRTRSRTMVQVNHPDPIGKTRGSNAYTADIELLLAEYNMLQQQLIALAAQQQGTGYGDVPFSVLATHTENGLDTIQDALIGCTMDTTEGSHQVSNDPTKRKFELNPLKIYFNGVDDLGLPLGAPPGGGVLLSV